MLTLTPVVCVLSAIAFSECFSYCLQDEKEKSGSGRRHLNNDGQADTSSDSERNDNGPERNSHKKLYDKVSSDDFIMEFKYQLTSARLARYEKFDLMLLERIKESVQICAHSFQCFW